MRLLLLESPLPHAFPMPGVQHRIEGVLHAADAIRKAHPISADLLPVALACLPIGKRPRVDVVHPMNVGEAYLCVVNHVVAF